LASPFTRSQPFVFLSLGGGRYLKTVVKSPQIES
jgi:hypothetical protein